MPTEDATPAGDQRRRSVDGDDDGGVSASDGGSDASAPDDDGAPGDPRPDGAGLETHTIRLELADEPGELLSALRPIADNGGNLLSIFHERGNLTPRGHIPVEVDLECPPDRFDGIVEALRAEGVDVIQSGRERYGETVTVLLTGHLVDTDLSDTIRRISACADAAVEDVALSAPGGTEQPSSARLRLGAREGGRESVLESVRAVADEKGLDAIEPLLEAER